LENNFLNVWESYCKIFRFSGPPCIYIYTLNDVKRFKYGFIDGVVIFKELVEQYYWTRIFKKNIYTRMYTECGVMDSHIWNYHRLVIRSIGFESGLFRRVEELIRVFFSRPPCRGFSGEHNTGFVIEAFFENAECVTATWRVLPNLAQ